MKAAGIYQNMLEELESIRNISKMSGHNIGEESFWKVLKQLLQTDLNKNTLKMLMNVMQAQALYLIYNNIQQKNQRNQISDSGELTWQQMSITRQISEFFSEAYKMSKKKCIIKPISMFKQEQREYEQVSDIHFNCKRFELLTLQTMAKYYYHKADVDRAF